MTDKRISPLRQRMIEDMTVRGFTPSTQGGYLAAVGNFTAFFGRSPDRAEAEDLRRYQLHMRSNGASAATMNAAVSALRFFFTVTDVTWTATDDTTRQLRRAFDGAKEGRPASTSGSHCTRSGTALPPTCWSKMSISG